MTPEARTVAAVGAAPPGLGRKLDSHVRAQGENLRNRRAGATR